MQRLRDVLRDNLARSLAPLSAEDRLAAAWPVACGPALAAHGELLRLTPADPALPGSASAPCVLHVQVTSPAWHSQFLDVRSQLTADLARIAGVPLAAIHFESPAAATRRGSAAATARSRSAARNPSSTNRSTPR